jgi:hypothetical protein
MGYPREEWIGLEDRRSRQQIGGGRLYEAVHCLALAVCNAIRRKLALKMFRLKLSDLVSASLADARSPSGLD